MTNDWFIKRNWKAPTLNRIEKQKFMLRIMRYCPDLVDGHKLVGYTRGTYKKHQNMLMATRGKILPRSTEAQTRKTDYVSQILKELNYHPSSLAQVVQLVQDRFNVKLSQSYVSRTLTAQGYSSMLVPSAEEYEISDVENDEYDETDTDDDEDDDDTEIGTDSKTNGTNNDEVSLNDNVRETRRHPPSSSNADRATLSGTQTSHRGERSNTRHPGGPVTRSASRKVD